MILEKPHNKVNPKKNIKIFLEIESRQDCLAKVGSMGKGVGLGNGSGVRRREGE